MIATGTSIVKLAARCPARTEPLVAQLRLAQLIGSADIAPPGFPPQSILFVRRMKPPRGLSLATLLPGRLWEQSAREELAALYRRAVRASRGLIPHSAEALLFTDMAEFLACLGLAVETGTVETHWCWQAALQGQAVSAPALVERIWTERLRFVPAALAYLVEWGWAAPVLRRLSEAGAARILARVVVEFDLPFILLPEATNGGVAERPSSIWMATRPARGSPSPRGRRTSRTVPGDASPLRTGDAEEVGTAAEPGSRRLLPPWNRWHPQADRSWCELPIVTQHLLGVSLALFQAPALARSTAFAAEVVAWRVAGRRLAGESRSPAKAAPRAVQQIMGNASASRSVPAEQVRPQDKAEVAHSVERTPEPLAAHPIDNWRWLENEGVSTPRPASAPRPIEPPGPSLFPATGPARSDTRAIRQDKSLEGPGPEAKPNRWESLEGIETEVGGVLFLLNLAMQLDLPRCFDEECRLSDHLSGWGVTELFGRAFLKAGGVTRKDDKLWALLARLDGRNPGDPIAPGFDGSLDYYIPAAWLRRYCDGPFEWTAVRVRGRLVIRDRRAGYPVLDVALKGRRATAVARGAIERYRDAGLEIELSHRDRFERARRRWFAGRVSAPLRRWLERVFPFVRYAMFRALGDDEVDDAGFARILLRRGRVYSTATHVDLVMELGNISLPLRRAGLDLNPGWVPELMRVVSFHFD